MNKSKALLLFSIFLITCVSALWGSDVNIPNTFSGGSPAYASEMNDNFSAVEAAVDDNDARIDTNIADITSNSTSITANTSNIVSNSAAISATTLSIPTHGTSALSAYTLTSSTTAVGSVLLNAPSAGFAFVLGSGMLQITGKTTAGYASAYVGVSDVPNSMASNNRTRLYLSDSVADSGWEIPFTVHGIFPVTAGNNTFYLTGIESGASGSATVFYSRLTAIFIKN